MNILGMDEQEASMIVNTVEIRLNAQNLALIQAALAEEMPFGQIFTCAIDSGGEHLECEVDYDGEFSPQREDNESGSLEDWACIRVLHPRYLLDMARFWVRMEDGLLNIDPELKADIFQAPEFLTERLIAFLDEVLMPAIESRICEGNGCKQYSPPVPGPKANTADGHNYEG
jgi:hypothetical protein